VRHTAPQKSHEFVDKHYSTICLSYPAEKKHTNAKHNLAEVRMKFEIQMQFDVQIKLLKSKLRS